jgi:ribosomal protein S27AE
MTTKQRSAPRATGEYGNGTATLQGDALAAAGLTLVRHLDGHGKVVGETVIPTDEVPEAWTAQHATPTRRCGACHTTAWRLDRGTGQSWICGRCHP